MSIELAEQLKTELTDKYVVVSEGVPELRRFLGLTGRVKTVNMNCRVLVEFNGPEDISWYDIDPSYLKVVDGPIATAKPAATKPAATKPAQTRPAAAEKPAAGLSPLEMARRQGAAGSGSAATASAESKPAPAATSGAKLSPLELARQQGAVSSGAAPAPAPEKETAATSDSGKKPSPLELARQQGAVGSGDAAAAAPAAESKPAEAESEDPVEPSADEQAALQSETEEMKSAAVDPADANLSPLELARKQGAFKG